MTEEKGFNVVDPLEIGDLSDVQKSTIPPTSNVKLRINKVTNTQNEAGTFRQLNCSFKLEDGVIVNGELKYRGAMIFTRVPYFADPEIYTKDFFKTKQHLLLLKLLLKAVEDDVTNVKITDEYLESLTNKIILGNVRQIKDNLTGEIINTVNGFKALPESERV